MKSINEACKRWWEWKYGEKFTGTEEELWEDFHSWREFDSSLTYKTFVYEKLEDVANEQQQKLEVMQTENKQYTAEIAHHVLTQTMQDEKLKEKTQKLEAIRGLIPKLKCDRCISWVGEPCPETCEHLIYKKIREVLG